MEFKNQRKYIKEVSEVFVSKILSLDNIYPDKIDKKNIVTLAIRAAKDLLDISYFYFGEDGLFDDYTASQLDINSSTGELQIFFEEYIGTKITVSRFGKEDLTDLEIKLVNDSDDYLIVLTETKKGKFIKIKDREKLLIFENNVLRIYSDNDMKEFTDIKDLDFKKATELMKTDFFTLDPSHQIEGQKTKKVVIK